MPTKFGFVSLEFVDKINFSSSGGFNSVLEVLINVLNVSRQFKGKGFLCFHGRILLLQ